MANYEKIKDYFFGRLSESDQLSFEEEYFISSDALTTLYTDFDELVDDYLQGRLSATECQKFEERLQQLPVIREKVETDRMLLRELENIASSQVAQPSPVISEKSFVPFWNWRFFPIPALLAAAFLIGIIWFFSPIWNSSVTAPVQIATNESSPSPSPEGTVVTEPSRTLHQPVATPSSSKVTPPVSHQNSPVIASFLLPAEIVRGNESVIPLSISPDVTALRLQLELNSSSFDKVQVSLQTNDGVKVKSWKAVQVVSQDATSLVVLNISAALLHTTNYTVQVSNLGESPNAFSQEFHFHLEKK